MMSSEVKNCFVEVTVSANIIFSYLIPNVVKGNYINFSSTCNVVFVDAGDRTSTELRL